MGLDKHRPVTLQQVLTKLLTGVLAARLNRVMLEGGILDPAQSGFVGGGEVGQPLHGLVAVLEHALQARQGRAGAEGTGEVHLCLFDFSNAYCSITGWILELAMRRFHMPEALIDLLVGLVEGQRVAVRTAQGLTGDFGLEAGLPQGDPLSPLLWAICCDPMLCALREVGERGWGKNGAAGYPLTWQKQRESMWTAEERGWVKGAREDQRKGGRLGGGGSG
jgi:hypothetical protein